MICVPLWLPTGLCCTSEYCAIPLHVLLLRGWPTPLPCVIRSAFSACRGGVARGPVQGLWLRLCVCAPCGSGWGHTRVAHHRARGCGWAGSLIPFASASTCTLFRWSCTGILLQSQGRGGFRGKDARHMLSCVFNVQAGSGRIACVQ